MRVVVFGKSGQVATELQRRGKVEAIGRDRLDFADPQQVRDFALDADADVFINAAAYTAVDKAETEEDVANLINGLSVGALSEAAAIRSVPLIHISTDYVFDGSGTTPHRPDDPTRPLGAYGRSKLLGEVRIRDSGAAHVILRTSWVVSAHGTNFVRTMLRLGAERDMLNVVADQIGGPTPAASIAEACLTAAERLRSEASLSGTYHFSGQPNVSWADFAREIFRQAAIDCRVNDIPTSEYPTPAARPLNSRLNCSATTEAFGIERPDWRIGLNQILKELGAISQ